MKTLYCYLACVCVFAFLLADIASAQVTYTSTTSSNWSTMAWIPAGTPGVNDDVVIDAGHTVTIDRNISVKNLTVSGNLTFDATAGREVRVGGNVTVSSGGAFYAFPVFTVTGTVSTGSNIITNVNPTAGIVAQWHISGPGIPGGSVISLIEGNQITLSLTATADSVGVPLLISPPVVDSMFIDGNLVNNGKFDMSVGSDTTRCNVIFHKSSGDQTVSGTGDTTRFRMVKLDKGVVANKVLCSIDVLMSSPNLVYVAGTWEQSAGRLTATSGSLNITGPGTPPLINTAAMNITGSGGARMAGNLNIFGSFLLNTTDSLFVGSGSGKIDLTVGSGGSVGMFTKGTVFIRGKMASNSLSDLTINGANIIIDPQGMAAAVPLTNEYIFRTTTGSGSIPFTFSSGTVTILNPNTSPISTREEINLNSSTPPVITGTARFILGQGAATIGTATGFRIRNNSKAEMQHMTIDVDTGRVTLLSAITVLGDLSLKSGHVNLFGFSLILGETAMLTEMPGASIYGDSGLVKTTRILNAPSISNDIAGMGIMIGSCANFDTTIISRGTVAQTGNGHTGIKRYFNVVPKNATGLNASVRFKYDAGEAEGLDESVLALYMKTDSVTWASPGVTFRDLEKKTLTIFGLDSITRLTAAESTHPLGVSIAPVVDCDIAMASKWNLVSMPVGAADPRKSVLCPTASSVAFAYNDGYIVKESFVNGAGYWLKFDEATTVRMSGVNLPGAVIPVVVGWNLIGSVSIPIPIGSITTEPPGLIASNFFQYDSRYVIADTLHPGKGYWIKASTPGTLMLSTVCSSGGGRTRMVETREMPPAPPFDASLASKEQVPAAFNLGQNYPNPFNPMTQISFELPEASTVTLHIANVLGQEVARLLDHAAFNAGHQSVAFDASELPSGVYFYQMNAVPEGNSSAFTAVKRMSLVK